MAGQETNSERFLVNRTYKEEQMKITLELPDDTVCMCLNFILDDGIQMTMQTNSFDSKEMFDGNHLVIEKREINHD